MLALHQTCQLADSFTTDFFADIPTGFGSAIGTVTYQDLDGGRTGPAALAESTILTADAGLFFKGHKIGTWTRYESRDFAAGTRDEKRILVGLNYYPFGNNVNLKTAYGRFSPQVGRDTNQFVLQLQVFYY